MKIWVYLNGLQQGPYTLDELAQLPVNHSTPVWYEGLPQWMPASEAPVTASLFATAQSENAAPQESAASSDYEPSSGAYGRTVSYNDRVAADAPPAPPTFIGWSVFVLICCFPIGGILGIIFSVMSGNAYRSGDFVRAARLSEYSEWSVILSIVIGLIFAPLAMLIF